jgi:predicted Zn-dependent peptidase
MFSDATAYHYNSTWDFAAQVNLDTVEPLFDIIVREIGAILNGNIDDSEVEKAKRYALGKHQMAAQTVGQINSWYGGRYFFDGHIDDFEQRPAAIKRIDKETMVEVSREFARTGQWQLGGVGKNCNNLMQRLNEKVSKLF